MENSNKHNEILQQISDLVDELRAEPDMPDAPSNWKQPYTHRGKFDIVALLYDLHRARIEAFGKGIFKDTGWHILLEIFKLNSEGKHIHVSALCAASRRSQTTALRFLADLEAARLIIRRPDPSDRRRTYVTLTDEARRAMQHIAIRLTAKASLGS